MEVLAGPVLLALLTSIIGFVACLKFHPRGTALRLSVMLPTVLLTGAVAAAIYFMPRAKDRTYDIALEFVDAQGQTSPELTVHYTLEMPSDGSRFTSPTLPQVAIVSNGRLTISKKRIEHLKIEVEAPGFYRLAVNVGEWFYDVPDYIHKIDFSWQGDKTSQTHNDSMSDSLNWRPIRDKILRVVMFRHTDALRLPFPSYTEEDVRELDTNKKR